MTPWTAARQVSQSIINSWSLLKLMSIQSVMPSNQKRQYKLGAMTITALPTNRGAGVTCLLQWDEPAQASTMPCQLKTPATPGTELWSQTQTEQKSYLNAVLPGNGTAIGEIILHYGIMM